MEKTELSLQAFKRLPYYLEYLKALEKSGVTSVSAPTVAAYFGSTEVQVRKDFAAVSSTQGKPKLGFDLNELIRSIESVLGYFNADDAVLVGVGSLGHALISYDGFKQYGLNIVSAFDSNPELWNTLINGIRVMPIDKLSVLSRRMNIHIGIITVPAPQAQIVCDQLIAGGIKAIWNFAPTHLSVPEGTLVQNENMAASLAILSRHLHQKLTEEA